MAKLKKLKEKKEKGGKGKKKGSGGKGKKKGGKEKKEGLMTDNMATNDLISRLQSVDLKSSPTEKEKLDIPDKWFDKPKVKKQSKLSKFGFSEKNQKKRKKGEITGRKLKESNKRIR